MASYTGSIEAKDVDMQLGEISTTALSSADNKRVLRRIDYCIIPLMGFCYMLQFMDKLALSQATLLGLRKDIHLHGSEYSWCSAVFYFGYLAWSWPSSYLIVRFPTGKYASVMVFIWGVILMCHAACQSFAGLMTARFFLGVGEACLAPAFALITGMFYTRKEQPIRQGAWFIGNCIANMFGGLIAYGIGNITTSSLETWRLLFLILGSVTSAYAIVLFLFLPDSPQQARFLKEQDRQIAVARTLANNTGVLDQDKFVMAQLWEALLDPQTWALFLYTASVNIANGGLTSFGAIVIAGFGFSDLKALLIQMPMGATQLVFLVLTSGLASFLPSSRIALMMFNTLVSVAGMAVVYATEGKASRMAGLCLATAFATNIPLTLSLVSSNVGGFTKRSVTSASIFVAYCTGNIIGPNLFKSSQEPKYQDGLIASVSGLALGVVFLATLLLYYIWENRRRDRLENSHSPSTSLGEQPGEMSNKTDKQLTFSRTAEPASTPSSTADTARPLMEASPASDELESLFYSGPESGPSVLGHGEKQDGDPRLVSPSSQQINVVYSARTSSPRSALSTSHIPLPNSLILSQQDCECFQYIPDSFLVQFIGKPWQWSMLSYIHSRIASYEQGVMRAFIALASVELRCRYVSQSGDPGGVETSRQQEMLATDHYHNALGDLSRLVDRASRPERTEQDLDSLFATWFLLLWVGYYNVELARASQVHLSGIRSFLLGDVHGPTGQLCLPPASQQLLYFISMVDTNLALGNLGVGQLTQDLLKADSHLHQDRLFQAARTCLPRMWGPEYPAEQLLDDLENYRPLSFMQACAKLKVEVWTLGKALRSVAVDQSSLDQLWQKIKRDGEAFMDVLTVARIATNTGGRRVLWTIYHGALEYYAIQILFSCLGDCKDTFPSWLDSTLTDLLGIAYKAIGEKPIMIYRYAWPLVMALMRIRDPIHREWVATQVKQASVLIGNLGIPRDLFEGSPPTTARSFGPPYQGSEVQEQ
ncbi:hypothetical protein PV08_03403 [Exophiala spinifera]|uniref:Major facilitator superfamily (MFS) profile domain-containing protein n=1 Tax=Exophiala spinifera TaxID=91928 RepID=A0A0D1YV09_9EURO|nr:uncharacterized protein PV08_03403 [Exophiala spinifera]KIW19111.1 hypothetical protein PV08_03403 [Exophiala spinifera]